MSEPQRVKRTVEITIPVRVEADNEQFFQWAVRQAAAELFVSSIGCGDHGLYSYRSLRNGRTAEEVTEPWRKDP